MEDDFEFEEPSSKKFRKYLTGKATIKEYEENDQETKFAGYGDDETFEEEEANPFSDFSEKFVRKRERQMKKSRTKPRLTIRQQQIKKDNELWENNRLARSGVVAMAEDADDLEEDGEEDRVTIQVHNIIPPFLDGRIAYTCQTQPIIPVKDPTSDLAVAASKGSKQVRIWRDQEDRKKAQEKHWELAGSNIGNIMGIKVKEEVADLGDLTHGANYK